MSLILVLKNFLNLVTVVSECVDIGGQLVKTSTTTIKETPSKKKKNFLKQNFMSNRWTYEIDLEM